MATVKQIAAYIVDRYNKEYAEGMDEMKLHKLLYFAQRENLIINNEPLFNEQFHAAQYGPVMLSIRKAYHEHELGELPCSQFLADHKTVFDNLFSKYAPQSSWSLSDISHGEISWRNASEIEMPEGKYPRINNEDIRLDAQRVKIRMSLARESC